MLVLLSGAHPNSRKELAWLPLCRACSCSKKSTYSCGAPQQCYTPVPDAPICRGRDTLLTTANSSQLTSLSKSLKLNAASHSSGWSYTLNCCSAVAEPAVIVVKEQHPASQTVSRRITFTITVRNVANSLLPPSNAALKAHSVRSPVLLLCLANLIAVRGLGKEKSWPRYRLAWQEQAMSAGDLVVNMPACKRLHE